MTVADTLYLVVSGATTARRAPELAAVLARRFSRLLVLLTPNAQRIVSPRELALVESARVVESYFDAAILPRPPDGIVLVAPCSFNTLHKLAHGIADSLAVSLVAEAIGRRTPVIVALSVNAPLRAHPLTQQSIDRLQSWGVTVLDVAPDLEGRLTMVPTDDILTAVERARRCP